MTTDNNVTRLFMPATSSFSNVTPWYEQDFLLIESAVSKYRSVHKTAESTLNKVDLCLLFLGVFGNTAALVTMFRRRSSMGTPSFIYHKALVAADLLFCINFLFMKFVEQSSKHHGSKIYTTYALAYYSVFINRALSSTCGYVVLYMSLAISFDRFVAIWYYNWYAKFNRHSVALSILTISFVLAAAINSWSIWVERIVVDLKLDPNSMLNKIRQEETELVDSGTDHFSNFEDTFEPPPVSSSGGQRTNFRRFNTVLYMAKSYSSPDLAKLIWAKNIYNMILRVAYPLTLTFLTAMVILGFVMRERRRRRYDMEKQNCYESVSQTDDRKPSDLYSNNYFTGQVPSSTPAVTTVRRFSTFRRRDRALYYLMVAVVILVFCQVIPREAKRVFELAYPVDYTMSCMEDKYNGRSVHERLFCFRLYAYGHEFTKLLLNTLTAANRSLLFYVYFALNRCFRIAVLQTFGLKKKTSRRSKRKSTTAVVGYQTTRNNGRTANNNIDGSNSCGLSQVPV